MANVVAEPHHAYLTFARWHIERISHRLRDRPRIVRIYQECSAAQLRSRSCELAEDQYSPIISLGSTKLLCHQIHAVFKRCDQGDIGRAITGDQLHPREVPADVMNRHPFRTAILTV